MSDIINYLLSDIRNKKLEKRRKVTKKIRVTLSSKQIKVENFNKKMLYEI